ncbi:MAG TPA: LysR family transcriptional regulator, partial [Polyangiaceae bacterium]|nr:LysR family transcriptional regulator [Polyangiaceae bacterium]
MATFLQDPEGARWDDVRVFLAAYQLGSLGAAGARLGLDVSTVSRRLTAFEAAIGAPLFDRSRRGLAPTRAAELALPAAEAMAAALARLARDASAPDAAAEGVVRLSVAPGFADAFLAPLVPALRARHPKITLELDASVRPLDLARREADLALRSVRPR